MKKEIIAQDKIPNERSNEKGKRTLSQKVQDLYLRFAEKILPSLSKNVIPLQRERLTTLAFLVATTLKPDLLLQLGKQNEQLNSSQRNLPEQTSTPEPDPSEHVTSEKLTLEFYEQKTAYWDDIELPNPEDVTPENALEMARMMENLPVILLPSNMVDQMQEAEQAGLSSNKVIAFGDSFFDWDGIASYTDILNPPEVLDPQVAQIYQPLDAEALEAYHDQTSSIMFYDDPLTMHLLNQITDGKYMFVMTNLIANIYADAESALSFVDNVRDRQGVLIAVVNPWLGMPNGANLDTAIRRNLEALRLAKQNNIAAINMWPVLVDPNYQIPQNGEVNTYWKYRTTDLIHPNGNSYQICVENRVSWDFPHDPARYDDPLDCTGRYNSAMDINFALISMWRILNNLIGEES